MEALIVFSNLPNGDSAHALAENLLRQRLAACVNILSPCRSLYRWNDAIEVAEEVPVIIKTTADRYAAVEAAIRAQHSYDVPEIVAVSVTKGSAAYLDWILQETSIAMPAQTC